MKLTDILKAQGLTDEQIAKVTDEMKKNKIYETALENADERYNKLKGQKEDLDEQIKAANKTIDELKKANKDNETLQETIKTHEKTIENLKKESADKIKNLTLDTAIASLLNTNKAKYVDLLSTKFDRDKLTVGDDGKVTGLDEQFKKIKEDYKDLFGDGISGNDPNNKGGSTPPNNPWTKEHFNLSEQGRIYRENPTLAKQLMASAK